MPAVFYPACKVRLQIRFEDFLPLPPLPAEPGVPGPQGGESFGPGLAEQIAGLAATGAAFDVNPYDCSVELNSYRKADTCRVTLPFKRVPFDPRIIRSATVQVFGGAFAPGEYADAMGPTGALGLQLGDHVGIDLKEAGKPTELFRGFVDDVASLFDGDQRRRNDDAGRERGTDKQIGSERDAHGGLQGGGGRCPGGRRDHITARGLRPFSGK